MECRVGFAEHVSDVSASVNHVGQGCIGKDQLLAETRGESGHCRPKWLWEEHTGARSRKRLGHQRGSGR